MTSKYCSKCESIKPLSEFTKKTDMSSGRQSYCIDCYKVISKTYYRTKKGLTARIYNRQKNSSKQRGHCPPNYSLHELREFAYKSVIFIKLYDKWVKYGYDKDFTPSADRIDDYDSYTINNLQWVTWRQNNRRAHKDAINGINNKKSKEVLQLSLNNDFVGTYYSASNAGRLTGLGQSRISECCRGKRRQAGGYKWMYI